MHVAYFMTSKTRLYEYRNFPSRSEGFQTFPNRLNVPLTRASLPQMLIIFIVLTHSSSVSLLRLKILIVRWSKFWLQNCDYRKFSVPIQNIDSVVAAECVNSFPILCQELETWELNSMNSFGTAFPCVCPTVFQPLRRHIALRADVNSYSNV